MRLINPATQCSVARVSALWSEAPCSAVGLFGRQGKPTPVMLRGCLICAAQPLAVMLSGAKRLAKRRQPLREAGKMLRSAQHDSFTHHGRHGKQALGMTSRVLRE